MLLKLLSILAVVTLLSAHSNGRTHSRWASHRLENRHKEHHGKTRVRQADLVIDLPHNWRSKRSIEAPVAPVHNSPAMDSGSESNPSSKPHIYYLHVESRITTRFATTVATAKLANAAATSQEATFSVILPNAAFISNFSMEINNTVIVGRVEEKEVAKQQYEAARAAGHSAGQVAQQPRETNKFVISVNVAAASKVTFNLTYQEILKRVHGAYKHVTNIQPGQPVNDLQVRVQIFEDAEISFVHVPAIGPKTGEKTNKELLKESPFDDPNLKIESTITAEESTAVVTYHPKANKAANVTGQLAVLYDVARKHGAGELKVVNGYFVHFFSPSEVEAGNKHVVFVLDKSGSMRGQKIQQTKDAMNLILKDLEPGDYFNILLFADTVQTWREESIAATADNVQNAQTYVDQIEAFGGTNINDALLSSLNLLHSTETSALTSLVIFLTDGEPTSGVTRQDSILANAKQANKQHHPIHSIGFGRNADFELLQKTSAQNRGLARKVYEDSDSALQLEGFYSEISNPLLTEVEIKYLNETVSADSLVQDHSYNLYEGSEYIITGKLANDQARELKTEITAQSKAGRENFHTICIIPPRPIPYPEDAPRNAPLPASSVGGFVERMWAYLTIKKLLDDSKFLAENKTEAEAMKAKALELSLKYNFVTELTSMVVTTPDQNVSSDGEDQKEHHLELGENQMDVHHNFHSSRFRTRVDPSHARLPGPVSYNVGSHGSRGGTWSSMAKHVGRPVPHPTQANLPPRTSLPEMPQEAATTVAPSFKLTLGMEDQTVTESEVPKLELKCQFSANHDLEYSWFKNDESIVEEPNRVSVESSQHATVLTVHRPAPSDSGAYECRGFSSRLQQFISSTATITVLPKPATTTIAGELNEAAPVEETDNQDVENNEIAVVARRKRQSWPASPSDCPRDGHQCRAGCHISMSPIGCFVCSCVNSDSGCPKKPLCDLGCRLMRDTKGCESKCYCPKQSKDLLPLTLMVPMLRQDYQLCIDVPVQNERSITLLQLTGDHDSVLTAEISEVVTDAYKIPLMRHIHLTAVDGSKTHLSGRDQRNGFKNLDQNITLHFQRIKYEKVCPCDIAAVIPHWKLTNLKEVMQKISDAFNKNQLPTRGLLAQIAYISKYGTVEPSKPNSIDSAPLIKFSFDSEILTVDRIISLKTKVYDERNNRSCLHMNWDDMNSVFTSIV